MLTDTPLRTNPPFMYLVSHDCKRVYDVPVLSVTRGAAIRALNGGHISRFFTPTDEDVKALFAVEGWVAAHGSPRHYRIGSDVQLSDDDCREFIRSLPPDELKRYTVEVTYG